VLFPPDSNVGEGKPNNSIYDFNSAKPPHAPTLVRDLVERIDPGNEFLIQQFEVWMTLSTMINKGFTALGWTRVLPRALHFLVSRRVDQLYKLASYSVRDVQYALFNKGYSIDQLLEECPRAPPGNEPDPVLRRVKGNFESDINTLNCSALELSLTFIFLCKTCQSRSQSPHRGLCR
jgi:hypothetical protein